MKIIKTSIGEDHQCLYNWNDNIEIECGEDYHTNDINKCFFEVKLDGNYIYCSGETINLAENEAWVKYNTMINCEHNIVEKMTHERAGKCNNCEKIIFNYFPSKNTCFICNKEKASLKYDNDYFCINHYIEKTKNIKDEYDENERVEIDQKILKKLSIENISEIEDEVLAELRFEKINIKTQNILRRDYLIIMSRLNKIYKPECNFVDQELENVINVGFENYYHSLLNIFIKKLIYKNDSKENDYMLEYKVIDDINYYNPVVKILMFRYFLVINLSQEDKEKLKEITEFDLNEEKLLEIITRVILTSIIKNKV